MSVSSAHEQKTGEEYKPATDNVLEYQSSFWLVSECRITQLNPQRCREAKCAQGTKHACDEWVKWISVKEYTVRDLDYESSKAEYDKVVQHTQLRVCLFDIRIRGLSNGGLHGGNKFGEIGRLQSN